MRIKPQERSTLLADADAPIHRQPQDGPRPRPNLSVCPNIDPAEPDNTVALAERRGQAWPAADVEHAVTCDQAAYNKAKPAIVDYLRHAQKKSGRRPMELVREFFRLSRGPGKLTLPEYVQYGVYDKSRYTSEDQARFITNTLHWPITRVCCDMTWQATTEDKWLCSRILERSGIRMPETLAVIDKTARSYPGARTISTAEHLRDFMTSQGVLPVFAKENRGICSFGAFLVPGGRRQCHAPQGKRMDRLRNLHEQVHRRHAVPASEARDQPQFF